MVSGFKLFTSPFFFSLASSVFRSRKDGAVLFFLTIMFSFLQIGKGMYVGLDNVFKSVSVLLGGTQSFYRHEDSWFFR